MRAENNNDAWAALYLWEVGFKDGTTRRQADKDELVSGIDFDRDNPPKVLRLVPQRPGLKLATVDIPDGATPVYCRRVLVAVPGGSSYHFCIGWTNGGGLLLLAVHPETGNPTLLNPESYRGQ